MRSRRFRSWLLAVVGVLAAGAVVFAYRYHRSGQFDESQLRDTSGIEVQVTGARASQQGVMVAYRIENRRDQSALSVVLNVELVTPEGQTVASNPLVNVLSLEGGESREQSALVPLMKAPLPAQWRPQARVSVVRWGS